MINRGEDLSEVTHEDIVLARRLSFSSMAMLLADRRKAKAELDNVKAQLAESELQLAKARADSYDKLTALPSRSLASRMANEMFLRIGGERSIDPIGAVCTQTDIEKFKEINRNKGYAGGDKYIASKGAFLKIIARDTDILTRWGGDEFVIVSPVFPGSSVDQVIENLDLRLSNIPQSPDFPGRIRWDHSTWAQGDDLDSMVARIDITTDAGKARANTSIVNQLYSID